jgi:hypothetical protein
VNAFPVLDVHARMNVDDVTQLDSDVVSGDLVHLNAAFLHVIGRKTDEDSVSSLLSTVENVLFS